MDEGRRSFIRQSSSMAAAMALWSHPAFGKMLSTAQPVDPALSVLRRFCLGIHPTDVEAVYQAGPDAWLASQLRHGGNDRQVEADIDRWYPTVGAPVADLLAALKQGRIETTDVAAQLKAAAVYRAAHSRYPLFEAMVDFWTNHFNINHATPALRVLKTMDDREVIRRHALGSFRDLLHASAKSPAMLVYLDNATSKKQGFNENYARELMELHTLGVEGGYTHDDVLAVARVLTGWSVQKEGAQPGTFTFISAWHDYDRKRVLGEEYPAGVGQPEGERLLDQLVDHPSTRRFIAEKLCRRFLSDDPASSAIDTVEAAWGRDGDIKAMLWALYSTPEFQSANVVKFRRPLDYIISMIRTTGTQLDANGVRMVTLGLKGLSQTPFDYSPPTGYPDDAASWASTSGMLLRWNMASLALGYRPGSPMPARESLLRPESLVTRRASPKKIVKELVDALVQGVIDNDSHALLVSFARERSADLPAGSGDVVARDVANLLFASPWFQWH